MPNNSWFSIPGLLSAVSPTGGDTPETSGSFSAQNVPILPGLTAGYDLSKFGQGTQYAGEQSSAKVSNPNTGIGVGKQKLSFGDISQSAPFVEWVGGDQKLSAKLRRRFGKSSMLPDQWEAELNMPQGSISGFSQDNTGVKGANLNVNVPLQTGLLGERNAYFDRPNPFGTLGLSAGYMTNPYTDPIKTLMLGYNKQF